jgi:hypothetical protein
VHPGIYIFSKSRIPAPGTPPVPGRFQFQRAQAIDDSMAEAIRRVCRDNPSISACYLLDAEMTDPNEKLLLLALTVDDEKRNMDSIAWQVQSMLRAFPQQAESTFTTPSTRFLPAHEDALFYSR